MNEPINNLPSRTMKEISSELTNLSTDPKNIKLAVDEGRMAFSKLCKEVRRLLSLADDRVIELAEDTGAHDERDLRDFTSALKKLEKALQDF